ncbi:prohibitin family protein [Candidatus Uhrbacteria bacterium]|nr:prohibitin family protein [Candidatus Uhrbacteria bacterium]
MPPFLQRLRNLDPQRLLLLLIGAIIVFSILGKLLIPIMAIAGIVLLAKLLASTSRASTHTIPAPFLSSMRTRVPWIILAVVLLLILGSGVVIISAGSTGVVHLFGKVRDQELRSGIHLINPLAKVERMSIRTEEFSMTQMREGGSGDAITVLTKEGLDVTLDLTVLYRLQEAQASDVFKAFGPQYRDRIIRPVIRSAIRQVVAEFEAKDIYSEKREEVGQKLRTLIARDLEPRGIVLEEVLLRDVELPERLMKSIQEKLASEQEAQRYNFLLDQARKEAERKRIEAEGQRDAQRIINESLTPAYLHFKYIESLKDRQGTIYVPVNPQNGLPLLKDIGR